MTIVRFRRPYIVNQKGGAIQSGLDKRKRTDRRETKAALKKGRY